MREELARLVHPVLDYGLSLRDRLLNGESPDFEFEQVTLRGMLLSDHEARRWPDFGGDAESPGPGKDDAQRFLGIRYALTCWLDELFIQHSPWESRWTERTLEEFFYAGGDRAGKFWRQVRLAEERASGDPLEAFYLCVMLGFRGEMVHNTEHLRQWAAATQKRMAKTQQPVWQTPPEIEPPTYVPPLRGRDVLQRMVVTCGMMFLLMIPVVVFFVVRRFGQ